jgi:hypothetical protein
MLSALIMVVFLPGLAHAQNPPSHWGVVMSFTPERSWNVNSKFGEFLFDDAETAEIEGSDFSIGIARGRDGGGDWGVSFVRRSVKDGSLFESTGLNCDQNNNCTTELSSRHFTRGVKYTGVEFHKFTPFVTIQQRVQIGLNYGGGVGSFSGDLERHFFRQEFFFSGGQPRTRTVEDVTMEPMKDFPSFSPFPLGKVEAAVAVVVVPGLKVRASGGFNFPGHDVFRLTGVYFFGAN